MDPFDFNFADYFSGDSGGFEDWLGQTTTTAPKVNWWDQDYSGGGDAWQNTGQGTDLSAYDVSSLGGDFGQQYGQPYEFNTPTSPTDSASSWMDKFGGGASKVWDTAKSNPMPLMALGGMGLQALSTQSESDLANKLRKAQSQGATNYMNALQSGKEEAKSSYLQNTASQKSALAEKLARNTADSGGANPRRTMEGFDRTANEGYGKFLLNLAQAKTPDLSAFTQQAGGDVSDDNAWWRGLTGGGASTLGSLTGTMSQLALLQALGYGK